LKNTSLKHVNIVDKSMANWMILRLFGAICARLEYKEYLTQIVNRGSGFGLTLGLKSVWNTI
jgi:hypothetical protein